MHTEKLRTETILAATAVLLLAALLPGGAAGGWVHATFEENIDVSFSPAAPQNLDAVNVTITAKELQTFGGANLYYNMTPAGSSTPVPGGPFGGEFRFAGGGQSSMYFVIPGSSNAGGSRIDFFVVAWDPGLQKLTSTVHSYTPARNGSFASDSFTENILVSQSPQSPRALEPVNLSVQSRSPSVRLERVDVLVRYQAQGGNWSSEGAVPFRFDNPFSGTAVIGQDVASTPNRPGFNVSYRVDAYDMYMSRLSSGWFQYGIPAGDNPDPTTYVALSVLVRDETLGRPVDGARVRFENDTWSHETTTIGGVAYTVPAFVHWGTYRISVEYGGQNQSRTVTTTTDGQRNIAEFRFSRAAAVFHPMRDSPGWEEVAGTVAALVIVPLAVWGLYRKRKLTVEELTEEQEGKQNGNGKGRGAAFWKGFEAETKQPRLLVPVAFCALSALGASFVPFYPWWMVALVAGVLGALAYRFPYISLLFLSLFVSAAAAYQTAEFGLLFLVFSIFVLAGSFFDWRFGFLVFAAVFLARLGVPFVIPALAAVLVSPFIAVAVAAVAGLFLTFLVTCGDQVAAGLLAGAPHATSFITFSDPVKTGFVPGDLGAAFSAIGGADTDAMASVINSNLGASMAPFLVVACWCLAAYLLAQLSSRRITPELSLGAWLGAPFKSRDTAALTVSAALLVALPGPLAMAAQGQLGYANGTILVAAAAACGLALTLVAAATALMTRDLFAEYYVARMGVSGVGTRVSDMKALGRTSFDMVGGLRDVKQDLKEGLVVPLLRPDISERFGIEPSKGILLFGPPGCGKTLLMKALATELNVEMINVKCSDVMSKWYGESEGKMAELFRTAKERKPCIIFFDEVDAIAKSRDLYSADDVTPRLLSIMLSEMDGMDRASGLIFVGSTNKPELIDPALLRPGRFDKIIYVPPPDIEERKEILKVHLRGKPMAGDIDVAQVSKSTERFSGADLSNLVKEAATAAMRRSIRSGKVSSVGMEDFQAIMPRMKPSISPTMVEEYQRIKARYERKIHDLARTERRELLRFKDVGDLEEAKKFLRENAEIPLRKPELVERFRLVPRRALMLYGPPGCGKAYLVKAFANESQLPLSVVNGHELAAAVLGQGEDVLKELAQKARDSAPSLVLVTDIDALSRRPGTQELQDRILQTRFLAFVDLFGEGERVAIIATTDRPSDLDGAFLRPGRFDRNLHVPPPDRAARRQILETLLAGVPRKGALDIDWLLDHSEGCNGENLSNVVNDAKFIAIGDSLEGLSVEGLSDGECSLEMHHLEEAAARYLRPLPQELVDNSLRFREAAGRTGLRPQTHPDDGGQGRGARPGRRPRTGAGGPPAGGETAEPAAPAEPAAGPDAGTGGEVAGGPRPPAAGADVSKGTDGTDGGDGAGGSERPQAAEGPGKGDGAGESAKAADEAVSHIQRVLEVLQKEP
ncbi:MAG: AAA family ATPase [Euryarchaeota archaeon]|nr:AAA family ATPase [Euryarchaeota archaeon]